MRRYFTNGKAVLGVGILTLSSIGIAAEGWLSGPPRLAKTTPTIAITEDEAARSKKFSCLPKDVRADEVASYALKGKHNLTVENQLAQMKARCRRGKLVDAKGREVRFFRPSCWGNPPPDYLEIRQRENAELAALKKRYTVIVFGCNPMIE